MQLAIPLSRNEWVVELPLIRHTDVTEYFFVLQLLPLCFWILSSSEQPERALKSYCSGFIGNVKT